MRWRLLSVGLLLLTALVATSVPPAPATAGATFTLVGRIDGGRPSGAALVTGDTLVLVSDDSGALTRYVVDLRWVRGRLPSLDQDDLIEVEIERLPDGTLVATSVVNLSDRRGTVNQGASTGSRAVAEQRSPRDDQDDDTVNTAVSPSQPTATVTATTVATMTATATPRPFTGMYVTNGHAGGLPLVGVDTVSAVTRNGTISTYATGFFDPRGLALDRAGNLYVADFDLALPFNSPRGVVRKVAPGGSVSTFAVGFTQPDGLVLDAAGNLYVADFGPGFGTSAVSKVSPDGTVSVYASGFSGPSGLALDGAGNLYVASVGTGRGDGKVSKVTRGGSISTYATGFTNPRGLALDGVGNLYVANLSENTVSKVAPDGTVSTYAIVASPLGLALDEVGNLYVANYGTTRVSKVAPDGTVSTFASGAGIAFPTYIVLAP